MAAGCFGFFVPFCILMGILAFFGMNTLNWDNVPIHGIKALFSAPFIGVFVAALFTGLGGVGVSFGLWLYSQFRPLTLKAVPDTRDATEP